MNLSTDFEDTNISYCWSQDWVYHSSVTFQPQINNVDASYLFNIDFSRSDSGIRSGWFLKAL